MERRLTAFLMPLAIVLLGWFLFFGKGPDDSNKPKGQDPQGTQGTQGTQGGGKVGKEQKEKEKENENENETKAEPKTIKPLPRVSHVFGEKHGLGFEVTWSRYGAGVVSILLNDHYMSVEAKRRADEDPYQTQRWDYYPIVAEYDLSVGYYGLVLETRTGLPFAKAIDGSGGQAWEVVEPKADDDEVHFFLDMEDGLVLEKVFRYVPGRRDLEIQINLKNQSQPKPERPLYDLWLRGVEVWNPTSEHLLGNPAVAIGRMVGPDGPEPTEVVAAAEAARGRNLLRSGQDQSFDFAGTTNRFFAAFLYADEDDGEASREAIFGVGLDQGPASKIELSKDLVIDANSIPQTRYMLRLDVPAVGGTTSLKYHLYLGPKSTVVFDEQPEYEGFGVIMDRDLTPPCCQIPGVKPLAKGLIGLLRMFHSLVGNWGAAIIMLTILVRGLMFPVNFHMQRTMRAHGQKMAVLKPKMDELQVKYKKDPKKLQQEMMKFQKEHKLLTAPLKGCLPMFLTMPVWIGLFTSLRVMYDLRHQSFFGWITDLSKPDQLFELGFSWLPYFNLLPILMVILWLALQMGTPLPKDPQQRQMMSMMRFMPLMFGFMLYNYASGLMLYMITSSIWGLVEQRITKRILGPISAEAASAGPMPMI